MTSEWKQVYLEDVTEPGEHGFVDGPFGSNLPASSYQNTGIPVIRGSNLSLGESRFKDDEFVYVSDKTSARLQRSSCKPCDIVFTKKGTLGQTGFIPLRGKYDIYLLSSNQMKLTVNRQVADPLFVYYCVSSPQSRNRIIRDSEATGVPKINLSYLRRFQIRLPPLCQQRAIAHILGTLDDKIELNRRMNGTLEGMARAIFKSWFVDFDPVRAKAAVRREHPKWTAEQITRAACPTLPPDIAALFPDSLEDSELGEIPKEWRIGNVADIAHINASTLGRRDALDFIDYIEISEVMRGDVGKVTRYIRGEEPSRARRRIKHGDTVLSTVRPDRGAYFLALNPTDSLIVSTGFAVLTPKDGNWAFLHSATMQPEFGQELGHLADGGAYPAIRPDVVGAREITLPNVSRLIAAFDKITQPLFLRSAMNRKECKTLTAARDALLPKLISGELRVPDAECLVRRHA